MQLPHWTEAIYKLNNAILETNSVAGGAENGQFIYISQSGDIILELDDIKVSGFTLVEFDELVNSKQFHLLSAVQTKHSHGLTHDLKSFLNQSFPKNSSDKSLQDLVRENIYKRTVPCTTRPPRPGEQDKIDYHFLSKSQFLDLNNRGMLLEYGFYSGHYYGTLKPLCDLNVISDYQPINPKLLVDETRHAWDANHPAVALASKKSSDQPSFPSTNPLYENHESIRMHRQAQFYLSPGQANLGNLGPPTSNYSQQQIANPNCPNIVSVDTEALPPGWARVFDQTHGTYYIDHNTRRTQYERPYEVELTKGAMGFGFTLVEADNGMLLVRSIIQGGPAHLNGSINPGDILISAVGVSFAGLQHTDVARLFSTFAVGDRIRLTFARSCFAFDDKIVPDEYLFSNGTNGDLAIAVNPNNCQPHPDNSVVQSPHIVVNQEFESINVSLRRGSQGFGFTISDSMAGQKVRKIQNNETCANLKQGDILLSINGEDITSLSHKEVVERLKNCPAGEDVKLTVKRKKRFRSKTPMAMHTDAASNGEYSLDSTPQRNCKTPSLDGLMLRHPNRDPKEVSNDARPMFMNQIVGQPRQYHAEPLAPSPLQRLQPQSNQGHPTELVPFQNHSMAGLPIPEPVGPIIQSPPEQQIYGYSSGAPYHLNSSIQNNSLAPQYSGEQQNPTQESFYQPSSSNNMHHSNHHPNDQIAFDLASNSAQASEIYPPSTFQSDCNDSSQVYQFNNFMQNDKLIMSQIHQQQQPTYQILPPQVPMRHSNTYQLPLYSNSEIIQNEHLPPPALPAKHFSDQMALQPYHQAQGHLEDSYYANSDIALQQNQLSRGYEHMGLMQQMDYDALQKYQEQESAQDDYEYHQIELTRDSSDSNWGIRLIGGAEVDRAISIGSIVFGGAASKNGQLKSGDEIISINGISVVGATHQYVIELISTCATTASLVVRRKKFAEACDVVLTRNMDEGFGFVIISSGNCPLIGRIIEGSPADRCKQLHVRDRIIAVNGQYISPNMQHWQIVSMIKKCGSNLRLRIIPVDCYTVELIKSAQSDNFGFSIRGGSEYDGTPLYILRVAPNGLARDLLNVGDQILEINNIPTVGMTHQQAASIIKYSDPIVKLKLRRNYVTPVSLLVDSPRALQKFNQVTAEKITVNQNATPVGLNQQEAGNQVQNQSASSTHAESVERKLYGSNSSEFDSNSGGGGALVAISDGSEGARSQ